MAKQTLTIPAGARARIRVPASERPAGLIPTRTIASNRDKARRRQPKHRLRAQED